LGDGKKVNDQMMINNIIETYAISIMYKFLSPIDLGLGMMTLKKKHIVK
jgi:hypothetical protein